MAHSEGRKWIAWETGSCVDSLKRQDTHESSWDSDSAYSDVGHSRYLTYYSPDSRESDKGYGACFLKKNCLKNKVFWFLICYKKVLTFNLLTFFKAPLFLSNIRKNVRGQKNGAPCECVHAYACACFWKEPFYSLTHAHTHINAHIRTDFHTSAHSLNKWVQSSVTLPLRHPIYLFICLHSFLLFLAGAWEGNYWCGTAKEGANLSVGTSEVWGQPREAPGSPPVPFRLRREEGPLGQATV